MDNLVGQVTEIELLIERGRLDAARNKLAQVLQENPGEPRVLQLQAFLHYRSGEAQEAREVIDELLMLSPDDEAARNLLFHIQDDSGEYQEAEQTILSLLRDSPEDADYYADYAMLMLTTINLEKADQLAAEALHLEPENQKALLVGVLCDVVLRRNKDSEERLTTLIRNYPDSAPTLVMLVVTLEDRNKYSEALEVSRQLLRSDPANERYVEMTTALQAHNHWSMFPIRLTGRLGTAAPMIMWIAIVGLMMVFRAMGLHLIAAVLVVGWLIFVIYSWVYPKLLLKWMSR